MRREIERASQIYAGTSVPIAELYGVLYYVERNASSSCLIIYFSEGKVRRKPRKKYIRSPTVGWFLALVFELEFQEQMFDGKGEILHLDSGYVRVLETSYWQLDRVYISLFICR